MVSSMTAPMKCSVEWDGGNCDGCTSCCATNAYPHLDGLFVDWVGMRDSVMTQLMMWAVCTLSWWQLGDEACPHGERRSTKVGACLLSFLLSSLMVGLFMGVDCVVFVIVE